MAVSDYRKMLFHLSEQITSEELKGLKFLCTDFISTSKLERITRAMDLFIELERQEKLKDTDLSLLRDLLEQLQRRDSLFLVDKFSYGLTVRKIDGRVPGSEGKLATSSAVKCWQWDQLVTDSEEQHRLPPAVERRASDSTRKEGALMINDVTADVSEDLGKYLNPPSLKNWKMLAGKLGFRLIDVENFKLQPRNSTQLMLSSWSTNRGATVQVLYQKLLEIGRPDAASVLEPYLGRYP